jgi:hypothetical protein
MLRRVALVRTNVSEERSASVITMTRIGTLGTTLAVTSKKGKCVSFCCEDMSGSEGINGKESNGAKYKRHAIA